ncbi:succinate semialdehyde dehydrogenase NADP+ linked [Tulasnella sp. 427]|nr:succinate semialdehyde dehydrogenase NADP+ linked [Tulasnella sp. 427]
MLRVLRSTPQVGPRALALARLASSLSGAFTSLKDPSLIRQEAFIDGKWVSPKGDATIRVTNPATTEVLGSVPDLGVEEAQLAINAAGSAFKSWSKTTAKQRHDILKKFYDLMLENTEDLSRIITLENGKTLAEAKTIGAEVIPSPFPDIRNITIKQPVGVCSLLTPWNFPSAMITRKLAPALAAGCTVVIKPPAETPFSCLALVELANRAGVPPGVINVVTTDKHIKEVGDELAQNKTVKKLSFTGSTGVAKLLMQRAASTLKKVSLEAGGNAPFIVFDDADIDKAVDGAIASKFRGSGQTCVCANRIYVQSSIYADFASRLADKVDKFKIGNGLDEGVTHGPLIHERAIEKVQRHVDDACSKGAEILVGGKRASDLPGTFFEPTVLSNVSNDTQIMDEETFGPVAALIKFETENEVIDICNSSDVGLAGYFFSRDVGRIWKVAEALELGMIGVNTGLISQACIPFGGVKESGLGREGGPHGIDEYMETKFIAFGGLAAK